ncbi:hypothetical protein L1987_64998 [Smallanthus sonchifolius]|uniref:Uncharacterized protein n=1 Tax=Smallanthus sonchifolius TaxID=185202 RepID=A0ACB9BT57_9ASTR|nr:hypothetical protein L1987_64998 [Smallanthus sonchifolius]
MLARKVVGVEFDKGSNGSLHATPCLVLSRKAVDGCMARIAPRLWMALVGTIALIQVHKFPRSQVRTNDLPAANLATNLDFGLFLVE